MDDIYVNLGFACCLGIFIGLAISAIIITEVVLR